MEARDPLVGTTVAERYRVLRLLGMGGMGAVYEVEHLLIGRRFALKTLHPEFARSGEAVLRFQREARAAAAIGDEHIIEVSDMGNLQDGSPFIVLELLDGEDLGHLLKKTGPMPLSRAIQLARQACDALEKAHLKGIVHRDIKPDNIFILQRKGSDFVKLLDFGISKVQESAIGMSAGGLTKTGMAIGTPYYMAPEQISGDRAIDARADVYAMGAVVFEMLMGCVPFDAATYPALVIKVVQEPPPSIRAFRADVPEDLEAVVLKALAKAPEARFASIREFGDALARFESLPSSPPRTAASSALASTATPKAWSVTSESIRVPKTGSPLRNGALAGAAALLIVGGMAWMRGGDAPASPASGEASIAHVVQPALAVPSAEPIARSANADSKQAPSPAVEQVAPSVAPLAVAPTVNEDESTQQVAAAIPDVTESAHEPGRAPRSRTPMKSAVARPAAVRAPVPATRTVTIANLRRASITVTVRCDGDPVTINVAAGAKAAMTISASSCGMTCKGLGNPYCPPTLAPSTRSLEVK